MSLTERGDAVRGGRLLVDALRAEGVDTVFGMVGSHVSWVYDSLLGSGIRTVDVRHEQSAAYMADGYARATGRPGVVVVTAGPGALNTLTGVATAYADSSPILVIAGQVPSDVLGLGKGAFHECPDQIGMFRPVTGWSGRPKSVAEIPGLIHDAFAELRRARPRPAYLEIPSDLLEGTGVAGDAGPRSAPLASAAEADVRRAVALLETSVTSALWAGGGVLRSGASAELLALAEALDAPVFMTCGGKGAIPADHPLAVDYWLPAKSARALLASSDLVLAVGTRFTSMATAGWTIHLPRLLQIDLDPAELGKNYPLELGLLGDARTVLGQLLEAGSPAGRRSPRVSRQDQVARVRATVEAEARRRFPDSLALLDAVRSAVGRDAMVVCDITTLGTLARRYFPVYEPRTFICPLGFGTLGSAYPLALGAKAGRPDRPVVAICGDGGFLFNVQELATAVQCGLDVVVVLVNDRGYGALRDWQRRHADGRFIGVDLHTPDFVELARSFGADAVRIESVDALAPRLGAALGARRPTLLEVSITLEHPGFG
jgi:thiamine pyrophosphate-dependent acetolactate synthase large subunit-like protein